ncbi:glycosyltransferase involved in cell wall biosynthesis [Pedobacter sp. UYP24]
MIVSIITPVLNCGDYIESCLKSVRSQNYPLLEHILIDGGSCDSTVPIIKKNFTANMNLLSEPNLLLYPAINKAISIAKGDIVGILNADDFFANEEVISAIVSCFVNGYDAVYGGLNYVKRGDSKTICRKWKSGIFNVRKLRYGWMPPHPTLYLKRSVFNQCGVYSSEFEVAADYEFILRIFLKYEVRPFFLNKILVHMRQGGISNGSYIKRINLIKQDYVIIKAMGLNFPIVVLLFKKLRKIHQLI